MPTHIGTHGRDRASGLIDIDLYLMGRGRDTVIGSSLAEVVFGGGGRDSLMAEAGNDALLGTFGNDMLYGGAGVDTLFGGADDDILWGGDDDDLLFGGAGDDDLIGGAGNDRLFGGGGDSWLSGGTGDDMMIAGSGPGSSSGLEGGDGNDRMFGGDANDIFSAGEGADLLVGGLGNDQFYADSFGAGPGVGADTMYGGLGNDSFEVRMNAGDTQLVFGGQGQDSAKILGLSGVFDGRTGTVTLQNGTSFRSIEAWTIVSDADAGPVDWQTGDSNDSVTVTNGTGIVRAWGGDDRIKVSGTIAAYGHDGNDHMSCVGGATLFGGEGDDVVESIWPADDTPAGSALFGNQGDDRLQSYSERADTMTGGFGSDTFVFVGRPPDETGNFVPPYALDVVTDFQRGTDKLGLYFATDVISGSDPVATGNAPVLLFDTDTGILSYAYNGPGATFEVDVMRLRGVTELSADDVILVR